MAQLLFLTFIWSLPPKEYRLILTNSYRRFGWLYPITSTLQTLATKFSTVVNWHGESTERPLSFLFVMHLVRFFGFVGPPIGHYLFFYVSTFNWSLCWVSPLESHCLLSFVPNLVWSLGLAGPLIDHYLFFYVSTLQVCSSWSK